MSQEIRNKISQKVKKNRSIMGLTCEELSLILGYDNSYISKLENKRINISIESLEKIANFFGIDIKEFFYR